MSSVSSYPLETTGSVTSTWIPLTTAFSAPASCSNLYRDVGSGGTLLAYDPNYHSLDTNYSCNPTPVTPWWSLFDSTASTYTNKVGIGPMVCPRSWSVVQTSVLDSSSTFSMCCPSGYDRSDGSNANVIANIVGGAGTGPYALGCVSTATSGLVISFFRGQGLTTTTFATTSNLFALALIGMNIGAPTTTSTPASSTAIGSTTTLAPATATMSPNHYSNDSPSGLSTGAKAGIAVGVVALALLALFLVFFVIRRRKNKKQILPPAENNERHHDQRVWQQKPEMDGNSTSHRPTPELKGTPVLRLPQELEAR